MFPVESCPAPFYKISSAGIHRSSPFCRWSSANFPPSVGPSKEQHLARNSLLLVKLVLPFVHFLCNSYHWHRCMFFRICAEKKCQMERGPHSSTPSTAQNSLDGQCTATRNAELWDHRRWSSPALRSLPTPHGQWLPRALTREGKYTREEWTELLLIHVF